MRLILIHIVKSLQKQVQHQLINLVLLKQKKTANF